MGRVEETYRFIYNQSSSTVLPISPHTMNLETRCQNPFLAIVSVNSGSCFFWTPHQLSCSISMRFSIHTSPISWVALKWFTILCIDGEVSRTQLPSNIVCVCVRTKLFACLPWGELREGRQREYDTLGWLQSEGLPSQALIMSVVHMTMSYHDCDLPREVPCHICINNCICFRVTLLACRSWARGLRRY